MSNGQSAAGAPIGSEVSQVAPGVGGSLATDQKRKRYGDITTTHSYMVKIDGYMSSTTAGYEEYAVLHEFHLRASRETNPNAAQAKKDSGRVVFYNPILVIPNEKFVSDLVTCMLKGKDIQSIEIVRLSNAGDELNKKTEEYKFENCEVQDWLLDSATDNCRIIFRTTTFEIIDTNIDQQGGTTGNANVKYDLKTGQLI